MLLSKLRIPDDDDCADSLAASVHAILRAAGSDASCADLGAALGLSLLTVATGRDDDCVGDWPACGRDAFLIQASALFGLRLREVHPPDAARGLAGSAEFAQHFEASYRPIVRNALDNAQAVIAWQGWPEPSGNSWGVITATSADGIGLAGANLASEGRVVPLVGSPVQLYVAEDLIPQVPPVATLLYTAASNARHALSGALGERLGAVTGPAVYERWAARVARMAACPGCGDGSGRCHARLAEAIGLARRSAISFWRRHCGHAAEEVRPLIDMLVGQCQAEADVLDTVSAESGAGLTPSTTQSCGALASAIDDLRDIEQSISDVIVELADRLEAVFGT